MSARAARFIQAEVTRAVKAAKEAGASAVEVRPDGTLLIRLVGEPNERVEAVELEEEPVL